MGGVNRIIRRIKECPDCQGGQLDTTCLGMNYIHVGRSGYDAHTFKQEFVQQRLKIKGDFFVSAEMARRNVIEMLSLTSSFCSRLSTW